MASPGLLIGQHVPVVRLAGELVDLRGRGSCVSHRQQRTGCSGHAAADRLGPADLCDPAPIAGILRSLSTVQPCVTLCPLGFQSEHPTAPSARLTLRPRQIHPAATQRPCLSNDRSDRSMCTRVWVWHKAARKAVRRVAHSFLPLNTALSMALMAFMASSVVPYLAATAVRSALVPDFN